MGKIYELLRELEIKENRDYGDDVFSVYVYFDSFIEFLLDYCKDSKQTILEYLLNVDEFLKLDVYYNKKAYNHNLQDFQRHNYKGDNLTYPDDEPIGDFSYLTERYLLDKLGVYIDSESLFWKIDDILSIKEIKNLGIDRDVFDGYMLDIDTDTYQEILKENKFLSKRIELLRQGSVDVEIKQIMTEMELLTKELKNLKNENSQLENQLKNLGVDKKDTELHHRTANNASKIIGALAIEMLGMDLSKPYADETNGEIQEALEKMGIELGKDTIANWLKLAFDNTK